MRAEPDGYGAGPIHRYEVVRLHLRAPLGRGVIGNTLGSDPRDASLWRFESSRPNHIRVSFECMTPRGEAIVQLLLSGASVRAVERACNVARATVSYYRKQLVHTGQLAPPPRSGLAACLLASVDWREIQQRLCAGSSIAQVCREYGISPGAVSTARKQGALTVMQPASVLHRDPMTLDGGKLRKWFRHHGPAYQCSLCGLPQSGAGNPWFYM